MPDFRTVLNIAPPPVRIALSDRFFTIGSCFADVMGRRMATCKVQGAVSPVGTVYNPVSIHRTLELAATETLPSDSNYVPGEVVRHYDFHSSLSAESDDDLSLVLYDLLKNCRDTLRKTNWLIITYGTAWVYTRRDTGAIVANCHKQPAATFLKSLLSPADIEASFRRLPSLLRALRPGLKIILTISPVRHIRDTLEGNSVSKSVLRVACNNMAKEHPGVFYFPAYEIMMDDLRDYRFYQADMIHPNDVAEEYIWDKFASTWFDDRLQQFVVAWKGIMQALQHRPFHPDSEAHRQFLRATRQKIQVWSDVVDVRPELEAIDKQLMSISAQDQ